MGVPPPMGGGGPPMMGRNGSGSYGAPAPPSFHGRGSGVVSGPGGYLANGRFDSGGGRGYGGGMSNGHAGDRRGRGGRGGRDGGRGGGGGRGFEHGRGGGGGRGFDSSRGGGRGGGGRGGRHGGGSYNHSHGHRGDLDNIALPKQDFGSLVPFEKNFYVESPAVRAMTDSEVKMYRSSKDISVEGHDIPKPIRMFHEASFPGKYLAHLCSSVVAIRRNVLIVIVFQHM